MKFSRPEYWSGYPFPSPGDLLNPGIEPRPPVLQADSVPVEPQGKSKNTGVGTYPSSSGSSQPRNRTEVSYIAGDSLPTELWAPLGKAAAHPVHDELPICIQYVENYKVHLTTLLAIAFACLICLANLSLCIVWRGKKISVYWIFTRILKWFQFEWHKMPILCGTALKWMSQTVICAKLLISFGVRNFPWAVQKRVAFCYVYSLYISAQC